MTTNVIPAPSEHAEQCVVIEWWAHVCGRYGLPEFALYAVPNAGGYSGGFGSNARRVMRMKDEGVRPGMPDLNLDAASPRDTLARGLRIEMKRKPNKPTREQEAVLAYLRGAGYHAIVCWNADEAMRAITGYLREVE